MRVGNINTTNTAITSDFDNLSITDKIKDLLNRTHNEIVRSESTDADVLEKDPNRTKKLKFIQKTIIISRHDMHAIVLNATINEPEYSDDSDQLQKSSIEGVPSDYKLLSNQD